MAGEPFHVKMPEIWGVKLTGELPEWVSAKDVILEMLRRHDVDGGLGRIVEYYGAGLRQLSAMDRHVIANMGAELGATTTIFPADDAVRQFMKARGREDEFKELTADEGCDYDVHEEIDLSSVEPLIAKPSSPGNVVPVREVAGEPVYQAYIGSSANPGYRDFAIAAEMVRDRVTVPGVSFDINPTSRSILETLVRDGRLGLLLHAGARLHQAGCNGCIGMGQAPASGRNSLRTVPRNFPGRSGTKEDAVFLCSPETATAGALTGKITDPRELEFDYPEVVEPDDPVINTENLQAPLSQEEARNVELSKGPNIATLPEFDALPDELEVPILLKMGDDVSTDEIPEISKFVFERIDDSYPERADDTGDHAVVGGHNYGQGSSREHAAIAPRYLGLRVVVAKSIARIHWQNLVLYGVLPLTFAEKDDHDRLEQGKYLVFSGLQKMLEEGGDTVEARYEDESITLRHGLSERQRKVLLAGGMINWVRERQ